MHRETPRVLVVDRESEATRSLIAFLHDQGLEPLWARHGGEAFDLLDHEWVDCLVTELELPRHDGLQVLRHARERNPEVCAVVVAGERDTDRALEAVRQGAHDVQFKPISLDKLIAVLRRGLSHQQLVARVAEMEEKLHEGLGFGLTGRSRAIARIGDQIRHLATTRATVLIEGETGTGKGLVARSIHHNSPRKGERFIRANLAALAAGEIENELFGHETGESTGAAASAARNVRRGRFELAEGGTLFLDEITEAPSGVQVKLLRVLQDRQYERCGGHDTLRADVRILTATHRDLEGEVKAGRFREDLFHRLSAVRIAMPPLRERREDIPLLVESFVRDLNREHGRRVNGVTRGVLERFMRHPWPGNVRELRNVVEGMVVFAAGRRALDLSDLPLPLREVESEGSLRLAAGMTVEEAERQLIEATLRHTGYDKPRAAAMLGIGLRTLYRKIKHYGLS